MKANEAKLLSLLHKSPQFVIPIYQRTYSWTEKQCRQLWDDILRAGSNAAISVHFIGSIVYVEQGLGGVTHQSPLLVIDGQQRLTTVMLLIEALARAVGDTEPLEGFSAAKLRAYYLCNTLESGDRFFKLLLSQTDAATLKAIVRNAELPPDLERSLRVGENFAFFVARLRESEHGLDVVCRGLTKLVVVDIALARDQDNPQLIFESMNSTGKELSQADLIRNYVLMGLEPELQTRLYEDYWRPMERDFGQDAYGTQFDSFMRHYLTVHLNDNLTLTGYNAEYSDRPFAEKRDMPGGFKESPLHLNAGLGQLADWNEAAIEQRAARLAERALSVWPAPRLDPAILAAYRPEAGTKPEPYGVGDHPYLLSEPMRPLFEAFRREVLALDPCVTEEFLKLYVAYKAETNFVDVVPQKSRLRLSLNLPFADIHDPKGWCTDVTDRGRWGNGDVEVGLKSLDELSYIMGLVRQSYERQMGNGGES